MTRLTPYDSSISRRLREMWSCICKLQEQIGTDTPPVPAAPTNTVGLAAKPGVATTYMRSDAAPAIDQTMNPTWTGIHTFSANPLLKSGMPSLEWESAAGNDLGFINFGTGVPAIPSFISAVTSEQLRITVGVAAAATFTYGNAGQLGLGNPVAFGTAGQVLTSGGPTGALTWATPASGGAAVANPGAQLLGLAAINGSAVTAMRSDGAPALSQAIVPIWTGIHTFSGASTNTASAVTVSGATPQVEWLSTTGAANTRRWISYSGPTTYILAAASDDGLTLNDIHRVIRAGAVVQSQAWNTTGVARMVIDAVGTTTFNTIAAMTAATGATVSLKSSNPILEIWNNGAAADQKRWIMTSLATNNFQVRTANDDGSQSSAGVALNIFRNGGTIQDVQIFVSGGTPRIKVTAAATTILGMNVAPVTQAASVVLTAAQSGSLFHNTGAAGSVVYTLPPATVGLMYDFINVNPDGSANTVTLLPNGAETIRNVANNGIAGPHAISSAEMDNCRIVCVVAGQWLIMNDDGGSWNTTP